MSACSVTPDCVTFYHLRTNTDQVLRHTSIVSYICCINIHRVRTSLVLSELLSVIYAQEADLLISNTITVRVLRRVVLKQILLIIIEAIELQVQRSISGSTELTVSAIEATIQRSIVNSYLESRYTDLSCPLVIQNRIRQIQCIVIN